MVSRNSAFALTVMLLVSASAQASWVPSLSLPSSVTSAFSSVFNKENGIFAAKVAAALVVIDVVCKTGKKLWSYTPACVSGHVAKAHAAVHAHTPAFLKTPACPVAARLIVVENKVAALNATVFAPPAVHVKQDAEKAASEDSKSN